MDRSANAEGNVQYRVRWQGYTAQDDTWEPPIHLANAKAKIRVYEIRRSILTRTDEDGLTLDEDADQPAVATI